MTTAATAASPLAGRVAVVTGAAQGIGRQIAETLSDHGADIVALDRRPSDETAARIRQRGGRIQVVQADVASEPEVEAAAQQVMSQWGRIDILVNNAALFTTLRHQPFWDISVEEWDEVMQVNVRSVFLCSRAFGRRMADAESGKIINIASNVVTHGMADFLHYVTSKAAVVGLTRSLARELGPHNICVNAVSPGFVSTEITVAERDPQYRQQLVDRQSIRRPIEPTDIAEAIAFLADDRSRFITGQTLLVNGGSHMGPA